MENFAELKQRLLEIQSGGRHRSPELVAEDERLIDGLQKRILAEKSPAMKLGVGDASSCPNSDRRGHNLLTKEVGDILCMTTRTAAFHKYRIMDAHNDPQSLAVHNVISPY